MSVTVNKLVNPERCEVCGNSATVQVTVNNVDHYLCDDHKFGTLYNKAGPYITEGGTHLVGVEKEYRYCYRIPSYSQY